MIWGRPRLAGYATTDEALVLGRHGLEQYLAAGHSADDIREGRFFGVFPNGATTTIKTDRTGQEQMFLFRNGSAWAVSNSFFLLAMHVAKAHRLTLYLPALMSFHLKSGRHIGEQLVSHKTPVAEIQMIPATTEVIVDRASGKLTLKSHDSFEAFLPNGTTYEDLLLHLLQNRIRLLAAIGQLDTEVNLFLSGGYDSRVVLGLALAAGCTDALTITSRESAVADYTSAKGMVDALGLPLNQSQNRPTQTIASPLDSLRLWMLSCGGTYLPFYRVSSYSADPNPFIKLTGDQPTSWDHYVGRAKFNGTAEKIAADILDDLLDRVEGGTVASDFLGTFFDIGVEPDHPKAMTAYYSATRSRHHCGRHWYKSLGGGDSTHAFQLDRAGISGKSLA